MCSLQLLGLGMEGYGMEDVARVRSLYLLE